MRKVKISGYLSNFNNKKLNKGDIYLLDDDFEIVCQSQTNSDGFYTMEVKQDQYMGIAGVKDYGVNYLECWAWNVPAFSDLEINMRIDKLEVYALNAFVPQGGYPQIIIYFRPMSLTRDKINKENSNDNSSIAPKLDLNSIEVMVNDLNVKILSLNEVNEYTPEDKPESYLVSVEKPKLIKGLNLIKVIIKDQKYKNYGEAI